MSDRCAKSRRTPVLITIRDKYHEWLRVRAVERESSMGRIVEGLIDGDEEKK